MTPTAKSAIAKIRPLVNDPYGDYTTVDYCCGFLQIAQSDFYNSMLSMPIVGRPVGLVVVPSIGVGTTSLKVLFDSESNPPGVLSMFSEITSIKERPLTATSEADWRRMNPTLDIPGLTAGAFNHVYQFTGDDLLLPGADQDLSLRVFGSVIPADIISDISYLVPGTEMILVYKAVGLIALSRGNQDMASRYLGPLQAPWLGLAPIQEQAYFQKIIQALQETPIRQRGYSGRLNTGL